MKRPRRSTGPISETSLVTITSASTPQNTPCLYPSAAVASGELFQNIKLGPLSSDASLSKGEVLIA